MRFGFKNNLRIFVYTLLFVFLSMITFTTASAAGVPSVLGYQGKLTDSGGNPLGAGGTSYYFKFSLWDNATPGSGTKLWPSYSPSTVSLTVKQGAFSVNIGDTGYPDTLDYDFNTSNRVYLQVEVSSDNVTFETLAPRSLISSSAFSQVTNSVNGTADSSFGTTTPFLNTLISALSTNINKAVMTIKGVAGQVANLFNIVDSNNNSLFTVTAGGNVGIGTTSPLAKLHVQGSTASNYLISDGANLTSVNSGTVRYEMVTNGGSAYGLTSTASVDGGVLRLGFGNGSSYISGGQQGTAFYNVFVGSTSSPRLSITNTGNIGIGTANPSRLLDIVGTDPVVRIAGSTNNTGTNTLFFSHYNTNQPTNGQQKVAIISQAIGSFGRGNLYFALNDALDATNATVADSRLTILSNGNVGIGTTTPSAKLDVWGNLNIATGTTPTLFVNTSTGNVGVGVASPSEKLQVTGGNIGTYGSGNGFVMYNLGTGNYTGNYEMARFMPVSNEFLFQELHGGTGVGRNLKFLVGNANLTLMNSSGNVGVGTTTPGSILTIGSGQVESPVGSAAAPTYSFTNDLNTGMYNSAADTLGFAVGGTNRLGVNTTYIGSSVKFLNVDGASNAPAYSFGSEQGLGVYRAGSGILGFSSGALERMRIDSNGNVGIGTTTPSAKLDVWGNLTVGTSSSAALSINTATNVNMLGQTSTVGDVRTNYFGYQNTSNYIGAFFESRNFTNTLGIYSNSSVGQRISFALGNSDTGSYIGNQGIDNKIFDINNTNSTGKIRILTNGAERVRFDESGNVGIGTSTPSAKLSITGTSGSASDIFAIASSTESRLFSVSGNGNVVINSNSGSNLVVSGGNGRIVVNSIGDSGNGYIASNNGFFIKSTGSFGFGTGADANSTKDTYLTRSAANTLLLSSDGTTGSANLIVNGNIGIGTTTPSEKLSIAGNLNLTGALKINGDAGTSGFVLQSTGSGMQWVATSTLGLSGSGTITSGSLGQLAFYSINGTTVAGTSTLVASNGSALRVTTASSTAIGLIIKGSASQSGDLLQVQNSSSGVMLNIASDGSLTSTNGNIISGSGVVSGGSGFTFGGVSSTGFGAFMRNSGNASLSITTQNFSGANMGIIFGNAANTFYVQGASSQTGNLQEWRNSAGTALSVVTSGGSFGIGTSTPTAQLSTTGSVRFSNFAAGTLTTDSLGNVTVSSDERLKDISGAFNRGLEDVMKINPITYHWKTDTGYDTTNAYSGFSAQNMRLAIPEAVATSSSGYLSLSDRPIIAALVNAIKDLATKINGFATEFRTNRLCVGDTCIDEQQLKQLLQNQSVQAAPPAAPAPVIEPPAPTPDPVPEVLPPEPTPEPVPEPPAQTPAE